jgi:hypothetical protein
MLAKKKARQNASLGGSNRDKDNNESSSSIKTKLSSSLSLSSSSSSCSFNNYSVKKEDKDVKHVKKRRPHSIGISKKEVVPIEKSDILDGMIPTIQTVLFSNESNNNKHKGAELKKLLTFLSDWGSFNVILILYIS